MNAEPDPYEERRLELIEELRVHRAAGPRVLDAMARVQRHRFVSDRIADHAYENRALKIGEGQTISQPLVVAMMTEALSLSGREKVLEVGTGSGYQAAVLAELAREVHSVERCERLYRLARERLSSLGYTNVSCYLGDGSRGLPEEAPFDAICVTAASPKIPRPLREQLAEGGRMVIPIGGRRGQVLRSLVASPDGEWTRDTSSVAFVPLLGEFGFGEPGPDDQDA